MLAERAGPTETRIVVHACHELAKAYLRTTYVKNRSLAGLTLDDQAMDAIADLFERSGRRFPVIESYFKDAPETIRSMPYEQVMEQLRPLVCGSVTDRIFESNGEVDASLSRLIRSVKRAVKQHPDCTLSRSMGTLHLTVVDESQPHGKKPESRVSGREQPTISVERLAARLATVVRTGAQTPDLVKEAARLLQSHPRYDAAVPVTALALAIRSAVVEVELSTTQPDAASTGRMQSQPTGVSRLVASDTERLLDETIADVRHAKRSSYVDRKKLSPGLYASYFAAIRSYIEARYLPPPDPSLTHHEALQLHCPHIGRQTYRDVHRSTFEYLLRAVRSAFVERIQHHHRGLSDPKAS